MTIFMARTTDVIKMRHRENIFSSVARFYFSIGEKAFSHLLFNDIFLSSLDV